MPDEGTETHENGVAVAWAQGSSYNTLILGWR
jgi:hypothetical protein